MNQRVATLLMFVLSPAGWAFQPCPMETTPCASPLQVLLYLVFPLLLGGLVSRWLVKSVRSPKWKWAWLMTVGLVCLGLMIMALIALNAFLAPCSMSCWYKP